MTLYFEAIMRSAREAASLVGAEIAMPRQASRQTQWDGVGYQSLDDYYCVAFYISYEESLIASLELRFSPVNMKSYDLFQLHSNKMNGLSRVQFSRLVEGLQVYYCIDNLNGECLCWYEVWVKRTVDTSTMSCIELLSQAKVLFPSVAKALELALALPVTTYTVERSFSTLRRVKAWLRGAMGNDRLNGLCMMSVHREAVKKTRLTSSLV